MPSRTLRHETFIRVPGATVAVHREPGQRPLWQHRHDFLEIVVVLSGEAQHVTGRFRHPIATGDVMVIPRRRTHGYRDTRGLNILNILVRDDALPRMARDLRQSPGYHALFGVDPDRRIAGPYTSRMHLNPADLAQVRQWADRLEAESLSRTHGSRVLAEAYLLLIMGLLSRRYDRDAPPHPGRQPVIGRLLSWLEGRIHLRTTVAQMAREAGMPERSFHRRFLAATGRSPLEHLLHRRIVRAGELLLAEPQTPVDDVAARCGFADASYFARVFRSRTGRTPTGHRRRARRTPDQQSASARRASSDRRRAYSLDPSRSARPVARSSRGPAWANSADTIRGASDATSTRALTVYQKGNDRQSPSGLR